MMRMIPLCATVVAAMLFMFRGLTAGSFDELQQTIRVHVDPRDHSYGGLVSLQCRNSTTDTLQILMFHAYFNAFQPGSLMAQRAKSTGNDALYEAITSSAPNEIGKLEIQNVRVDGLPCSVRREGTVVTVMLSAPIQPGAVFAAEFSFAGQVPKIRRRGGRDNADGIDYSMAQWYPKLCHYDQHGWHANQYVGREFYGVYGSYDVFITLPSEYIVGCTGELQNPNVIGRGYDLAIDTTVFTPTPPKEHSGDSSATWHFAAKNVHDIAWVADRDYVHQISKIEHIRVHTLYQRKDAPRWRRAAEFAKRSLHYFGKTFHPYMWPSLTVAQSGDGGMEYPMLVMIRGNGSLHSLARVIAHEVGHEWFYGMVGNNETKHAWMDEGFTSYLEDRAMAEEFSEILPDTKNRLTELLVPERTIADELNYHYITLAALQRDEPLTTEHDRFTSVQSARLVYDKGASFIRQLEYSFGKQAVQKALHNYISEWLFKHPYPADLERSFEKTLGYRLDDIFNTFIHETNRPQYSFEDVTESGNPGNYVTSVNLTKKGRAHVPLRIFYTLEDGSSEALFVPSDLPVGTDSNSTPIWHWSSDYYSTEIHTSQRIESIRLDTNQTLLAGTYNGTQWNNRWLFPFSPPVQVGWFTRWDKALPVREYSVSLRPSIWALPERGIQIGLRGDGFWEFAPHQTTAGIYYNTRSSTIDWQLGFTDAFTGLSNNATLEIVAYSMDGSGRAELATSFNLHSATERALGLNKLNICIGYRSFDGPSFIQDEFSYVSATYVHKTNTTITEVRASFAGTESTWGRSLTLFSQISITGNPKTSGAVMLRSWLHTASNTMPSSLRSNLFTASQSERFDNIPWRFSEGIAEYVETERFLYLPSKGGFAGYQQTPALHAASLAVVYQGYPLIKNIGVEIPILQSIRWGGWGVVGIQTEGVLSTDNFADKWQSQAGLRWSLSLEDIVSGSSLLWMFSSETSLSLDIPLISATGKKTSIGSEGLWLGISREF